MIYTNTGDTTLLCRAKPVRDKLQIEITIKAFGKLNKKTCFAKKLPITGRTKME